VFACDYRGSIRDSLLIGCNVLKQLKFLVDSSDNEFNFTQVFDKYNYYFDENNAYQEVLVEEEE
ncbi:MAG: hypothetical protein FWG65_07585, partial [Turicibacter sp.]|nr:hypothetical protein [Turicibacter sp.]